MTQDNPFAKKAQDDFSVDDVLREAREITGADKQRFTALGFLPPVVARYLAQVKRTYGLVDKMSAVGARAYMTGELLDVLMATLAYAQAYAVTRHADDDGSDPYEWEVVAGKCAEQLSVAAMAQTTIPAMADFGMPDFKAWWPLALFSRHRSRRAFAARIIATIFVQPTEASAKRGDLSEVRWFNVDLIRRVADGGMEQLRSAEVTLARIDSAIMQGAQLVSTISQIALTKDSLNTPLSLGDVARLRVGEVVSGGFTPDQIAGKDEVTKAIGARFVSLASRMFQLIESVMDGSGGVIVEVGEGAERIPDGRHVRAIQMALTEELIDDDDLRAAAKGDGLKAFAETLATWERVRDTDPEDYGE